MNEPQVTYRCYGKVNLYLDVLDRRPDGYTNIETIFQSVGLSDTLTFETRESGITCSCSIAGVPCDDTNLAVRAARLLQQKGHISTGVNIHIEKHLPVAGGMAGGSANAAATLAALNEMWSLGLATEELAALALALGSDVPFCLRGGTAAATGRGEEFHALPALPETWMVLVLPGIPISAGALYNHPQLERSLETPLGGITPAFSRALNAWRAGDFHHVVFNRFEYPAFHDHPELSHLKEMLIESGCVAAAMSGSGSTLFGISPSKEHAEALAREDFGCPALAVPTVTTGVERVDLAPASTS